MCRVFGCVLKEPGQVREDLLDAANPLIRQAEEHDSGWGIAVYERADGQEPRVARFPGAAHADSEFAAATELRGRIFNVHVRRATLGGLTLANTHPFSLGPYSFGHNGTVLHYRRLLEPGVQPPRGETDSEVLFNHLMYDYDPADPIGSLRATVRAAAERSPFSGLNFIFCDGERLYAYRFGTFELHWLARPGRLLVSSERLTDEAWHDVQQDVLLVADPEDPVEPHAERLLGDELVAAADVREFAEGKHLRGEERGAFAAERAARLAAARE
jgi:predicted glutamine amidotransferase